MLSNTLAPPLVRFLYVFEQVYNVVCLSEVVLDVVVLGGNSELYKFVLKRAALLEETMDLAAYFHFSSGFDTSPVSSSSVNGKT